jgi:16S rRNA (guanine966-N2)-methyltransferase
MRIISGKLGGRRIQPPAHMPHTRPTTDNAKEGLFNVIQNNLDIELLETLDLFGGTGSISFELASRGARKQVIIEKDPQMHRFISSSAQKLGLDHVQVIQMDVFKYIRSCDQQFDLIFAGPHTPRNDYQKFPFFRTERKYGTTLFSIFTNRPDEA